MDPLNGMKKGGAKGLALGIGTGLMGAVLKPVQGVAGLVMESTRGVSSSLSSVPQTDVATGTIKLRIKLQTYTH
jgi:hypothetical protein